MIMPVPLRVFLACCLLAALPLHASAQSLPDLRNQKAWGGSEKDQFIKFLESGRRVPVKGSVKDVKTTEKLAPARKARYATLEMVTDTVLSVSGNDAVIKEGTGFGPKLTVGTHLFSWVRLYSGAQYTRFKQKKVDGGRASVGHFQFPVGLELALVPLGTPQTRYIIMRGGLSLHHFCSSTPSDDFQTSLKGWQGAWNLGMGYEWQIPDSRWRLHLLGESYSYLFHQPGARFYGLGVTGGVTYTF